MILTLTPNPALDITYVVDATTLHEVNRVREMHSMPGGKGVNVARVLSQLGEEVVCTGPVGGSTGAELRDLLSGDDRVQQAWTAVEGSTRRTITVVDPGGATAFHEAGAALGAEELTRLREDLSALLDAAQPRVEAVTVSGSLPPGMSGTELGDLVRLMREQGRPVLVDTSGPALVQAARAGATVLKPNAAEAIAATGEATPLDAAAALSRLGVRYVVCSLGPDGMLGLQRGPEGVRGWRARLPEPMNGNPTGAGDSAVAVLARSLMAERAELPQALSRAVAVSATAVSRPVAGEIDAELARELEPTILIEEIACP